MPTRGKAIGRSTVLTPSGVVKHGKHTDLTHFKSQLDALGLKIIQVTSDGNCLFRALADQLEGNEEEHHKYRVLVVDHITKHREEFEPFIEDDVPFDEYCQSMKQDSTWAGHMELQVASLVTHCNICIHRVMSPRWYIRNFSSSRTHMVHLSYHDGEHYNSVRLKDDGCHGPARPIVIEVDADLSAKSLKEKTASAKFKSSYNSKIIDPASVKLVSLGTGCENINKVEQILNEVGGDIDAAIEFLIAEQGVEENMMSIDKPCTDPSEFGNSEQSKKANHASNGEDIRAGELLPIQHVVSPSSPSKVSTVNNIARNKLCPCGSKKKYKNCCGTSTEKYRVKIISNQRTIKTNGRKGRAPGEKTATCSDSLSVGPKEEAHPDLGALCI
ncbi:hypothetical protein AMTR_s00035p00239450 [Amborella trichopoda]|uniref:OTU domain-containing protein n=1 Tax=Amborella trichopoda TaxID=13333 RepID=W1PXE8_AMBTC|nr:hypothetical protein AMTR_s00035p00239450 [Amborella trichopoda]